MNEIRKELTELIIQIADLEKAIDVLIDYSGVDLSLAILNKELEIKENRANQLKK